MNQHIHSGVWGHTTPAAFESYVIFCVGQDPIKVAAFRAWATGRFGFKSLIGCYKGQMEQSFIVNEKHLAKIRDWIRGEESVLHLAARRRGNRAATLQYADGRVESIGRFTEVSRDQALKQDSWTYDPTTGYYYICI